MATLTIEPTAPARDSFLSRQAGNLWNWLSDNSRGAIALHHYENLSGRNDGELNRMGLKRQDLVRHVFAPYYYG